MDDKLPEAMGPIDHGPPPLPSKRAERETVSRMLEAGGQELVTAR